MPTTRQQTTPRQVPQRAAKRPRGEATDTSDVSASGSKAVPLRRSAAGAGSSSGKKQKVQAEQAEQAGAPVSANDKENTPGDSGPRRSTRTRTARHVQQVTPGPGLIRAAKDQGGSTGRGASKSTQKKQRHSSTGRQSSIAAQGQGEVATAEPVSQPDRGAGPGATSAQHTASAIQPDGSPLQQLPVELVPTGASPMADGRPSVHLSSSQMQTSASQHLVPFQSPEQPVTSAPACTQPGQLSLESVPPQHPQSPASPAAAALTAPSPAPGPSSTAADPMPVTDPVSSQEEGSRHSSGHSNDHPAAVAACQHLNWDSAGPSSGPTLGVTKPPLNKGGVTQPAQMGLASAVAADGDDTWWDPTDMHKVQSTSPERCIAQLGSCSPSFVFWPLREMFNYIWLTWHCSMVPGSRVPVCMWDC